MAAMVLLKLAEMTGNSEWRRKAEHLLDSFSLALEQRPVAMPFMASALDFALQKPVQVVIAGERGNEGVRNLVRELSSRFLPNKIVLYADGGAGQQEISEMQPFVKEMGSIQGKATAYVCRDFVCKLPTVDTGVFGKLLDGQEIR
jgi:hypothetical protein